MFALTEIDVAAGLAPQSPVYAMRRERADFVEGTEACRHSVMTPELGLGISHDLRRALGARMAVQIGQPLLAGMYRDHLSPDADQTIRTIADGGFPEGDDMLLAMVRHADLVTLTPKQSRREDIDALATAGLTNPQIVALSELIAFVNYEARVVAGLNILAALS